MIINDMKLAILRVLANSEAPLTSSEIADSLHGHGRHGGWPAVSTVKANLGELRRNEGWTDRPWVRHAGVGPRNATTWDITGLGREQLAALDSTP